MVFTFFINWAIDGCFETMRIPESTADSVATLLTPSESWILRSTIFFNSGGNGLVSGISRDAMSSKSTYCHLLMSNNCVHMNGLCSTLEFGMNAPSHIPVVNLASIDHDMLAVRSASAPLTRAMSSELIWMSSGLIFESIISIFLACAYAYTAFSNVAAVWLASVVYGPQLLVAFTLPPVSNARGSKCSTRFDALLNGSNKLFKISTCSSNELKYALRGSALSDSASCPFHQLTLTFMGLLWALLAATTRSFIL